MRNYRGRVFLIILATLLFSTSVFASPARTLDMYQLSSSTSMFLNGEDMGRVNFIENGRSYVELRKLGDELGIYFDWDSKNKRVNFQDKGRQVSLRIDSSKALVDNRQVIISAPPRLSYGGTYLPVRAVTELLDIELNHVDLRAKEKQAKEILFQKFPGWRNRELEGPNAPYPFTIETNYYHPDDKNCFIFNGIESIYHGYGWGHTVSMGFYQVNVDTGEIFDYITGERVR